MAACGSPPQIVAISPSRGAGGVRSNAPVRIEFDRPMDQSSVATRFHLVPHVPGKLHWIGSRELVFEHPGAPFRPSHRYRVVLAPGYRDLQGNTNGLRHSWTFQTEAAPTLTDVSPASGQDQVDPSTYVTLTFSRPMQVSTLERAISFAPRMPFTVHRDPLDPDRVVIAPDSLLEPHVSYQVAITSEALDVDGNHLAQGSVITFTTGPTRPLHHWVSFIARSTLGNSQGVWIVDDSQFPRTLLTTPVDGYSWSPDGTRLLLHSSDGTWTDQPLDGPPVALPFRAQWAAYLASGQGYAFLDQGNLRLLEPDGKVIAIADDVREAAVAPDGLRIAFVVPGQADLGPSPASGRPTPQPGWQIDAFDVELRARYTLQRETLPIDDLTWSPDGQELAYRTAGEEATHAQVKVRSLRDGDTVTVATGQVSDLAWEADSRHLFVTAASTTGGETLTKVFRLAVSAQPPTRLDGGGMPAGRLDVLAISPSPDGHQLALIGRSGSGPASVWLVNADGTGLTQLTRYDQSRFPYTCEMVAWTPG